MKDLLEISCGLDVHKDKIVACILTGPLGKPTNSEIREFRDLNRYRKSVIRDITSQKNRVEKFLQSSGFRLSSFISDIFGALGRNIIRHLIEHGQIDRASLDSCLKTKTRNHIDEILMSVNGTLSEHQKAFLKILMDHYDSLKGHLAEIEKSLEADMSPFALQVEQLSSIYGISTTASCAIIAEIGIDMKPFKTAEHICSWAGLCPGNNESAGKRKSTSVTKGNPCIKSMLCGIAWVIAGKRNPYLSAWYWRLKQKKGAKKATIIALARKLLVIIYTMLKQGTLFDESCFEARRKSCEQKQLS
ncbi:IS110 family transposase [Candidatus Merdisoma sp. JLR.KK011]|uniref:IS110 family transposase n=1 Tax=Candidatus Merdisoma sp. JLR.KK011 TaxID=3114299 RepID=UPI002FF3467B